MDVTVTAKGDAKKLWDTLVLYLVNNKYKIEKQVPPTSLVAKRGSKAASLVIETKNINFRELHVLLIPQGPDTFGVRFEFKFPVWMITLPAAKNELAALADGYLAQVGMAT